MIIPRSIFLRQTYLKNKNRTQADVRNEKTLILRDLGGALRNPQVHKLGVISFFFSNANYPLMTSGGYPEIMSSITKDFSEAGYSVKIIRSENGVSVTLDWRYDNNITVPPSTITN